MCFGSDTPEVDPPAAPAETLSQSAPVKKSVDQDPVDSSGTRDKSISTSSDKLSIGTKRYRNRFSLPDSGLTSVAAPSGIPVNI